MRSGLKDQAMAKQSAGILLFRSSHELQILLVHPGRSVLGKKGRRLMVDSKGRIRRGRRCARCSETRTAGRNGHRCRRGILRVRDIQAAKWKTDFGLGD